MMSIPALVAHVGTLLLPWSESRRRACEHRVDVCYGLLDDLVEALCLIETAQLDEALYNLYLTEHAGTQGVWPHDHCPGCGFAGVFDGVGCILCGYVAPHALNDAEENAV